MAKNKSTECQEYTKTVTATDVERYFADWLPTPENTNALPQPLRSYIHELHTICDPAGTVRENVILKQQNRALQRRIAELKNLPPDLRDLPGHNPRQLARAPSTRRRSG
jgi:hypothetical protein